MVRIACRSGGITLRTEDQKKELKEDLVNEDFSSLYGAEYYRSHCGPVPYERNDVWLSFFHSVADHIFRSLKPRKVMDAGCALGLLVESFWDLGVEAWGIDISQYAISKVRQDLRSYCSVASIAEPITGTFDLITCIEVLEHVPEALAQAAIEEMCKATSVILFSSTPYDFAERTHCNVHPLIYWVKSFSTHGFWPDLLFDAGFLAQHAMLFRRSDSPLPEDALVLFCQMLNQKNALAIRTKDVATLAEEKSQAAQAFSSQLAQKDERLQTLSAQVGQKESAVQELSSKLAQKDERLRTLSSQVGQKESAVQELRTSLAQRDEAARNLESTLNQIQSSRGWRTLQHYYRLRDKLFPAIKRRSEAKFWGNLPKPESPGSALRRETPQHVTDVREHPADNGETLQVRNMVRRSVTFLFPRYVIEGVLLLRDMRLVAASGLFDRGWYLAQNPDVAGAGVKPLRHYLRHGAVEGRDPSSHFDSDWYLRTNPDVAKAGVNPLVHYLRRGILEGRRPYPYFDGDKSLAENPDVAKADVNPQKSGASEGHDRNAQADKNGRAMVVDDVVHQRFSALRPLRVYSVPGLGPRVTMVTDSINQGSLFGGVATAMILAALLAERLGAALRIITRLEKADKTNFRKIIRASGIQWQGNVEFVYADINDDSTEVDVGEKDLFLTTSWWTTWSVKQGIAEDKIIYLLQEDERMFYPVGDDYLRCQETLSSPHIRVVVNSQLLFNHFVSEGFDNIRKGDLWFEPSFPKAHFYPDDRREDNKKNFLFYARPNNLRNLYYRGLEIINQAVKSDVLHPDQWNLFFVGKDLTELSFARGTRPRIVQNLEWSQYAALLRQIDVGLCLMHTPHPSYPPLDLAACGAVAVTNRSGLKQSLESYSKNILCRDTDIDSLVGGIADAVILATDERTRFENYRNSSLLGDWMISFHSVLRNLVEDGNRVHPQCGTDKIFRPMDKAAGA
jgi:cyclopropane fatty-acyl-phospholipid synthase-like methyltransferase